MKKWIISILVFIPSLCLTAFVGFYTAIFLIGPHADILPDIFNIPAGLLLIVLIIGIPFIISYKIFIKFKMKES